MPEFLKVICQLLLRIKFETTCYATEFLKYSVMESVGPIFWGKLPHKMLERMRNHRFWELKKDWTCFSFSRTIKVMKLRLWQRAIANETNSWLFPDRLRSCKEYKLWLYSNKEAHLPSSVVLGCCVIYGVGEEAKRYKYRIKWQFLECRVSILVGQILNHSCTKYPPNVNAYHMQLGHNAQYGS